MSETPNVPRRRIPFAIGSVVVVAGGIIAIAVGVNNATNAVAPNASATPASTASPSASTLAFADCSKVSFGSPMTPLNEPASVHTYLRQPSISIDLTKLYEATITTSKGNIVLCLQPKLATLTVNNFVTLVRNHFYDGIPFHRVCPNPSDSSCGGSLAIAQGGDPNCINNVGGAGCGNGGPGYKFSDEPVRQSYVTGAVAMANSGPNTNGSQFFICTGDDTSLPRSYNLFGHVQTGLDIAKQLAKGDVMQTVTVAEQL
jgi:cyclophilin family peptidyl-prolyl cis-trans isomerase